MEHGTRKSPSAAAERCLYRYFTEGKGPVPCVVTGQDSEWHHLDDNPAYSSFENLIPLGSTLNDHLGKVAKRVRNRGRAIVDYRLQPKRLADHARVQFSAWKIGPAYGCSRLAYHISRHYLKEPLSVSMGYACESLYYARHRFSMALIFDVVSRALWRNRRNFDKLAPAVGRRLATELAGLFGDFGKHRESECLYRVADAIAPLASNVYCALTEAAVLRRRAMATYASGGDVGSVQSMLREASSLAAGDINTAASVANSRAWIDLAQRNVAGALDALAPLASRLYTFAPEDFEKSIPWALTAWNAAELIHSYAAVKTAIAKQRRTHSAGILQQAQALYATYGPLPFQLHEGYWKALYNDIGLAWDEGTNTRPRMCACLERKARDVVTSLLNVFPHAKSAI